MQADLYLHWYYQEDSIAQHYNPRQCLQHIKQIFFCLDSNQTQDHKNRKQYQWKQASLK